MCIGCNETRMGLDLNNLRSRGMAEENDSADFELTNQQLKSVNAAASHHALMNSKSESWEASLNRANYLKVLEKRASSLFNLLLLSIKSVRSSKKVSNNKF